LKAAAAAEDGGKSGRFSLRTSYNLLALSISLQLAFSLSPVKKEKFFSSNESVFRQIGLPGAAAYVDIE
jgi:hypothetical protein